MKRATSLIIAVAALVAVTGTPCTVVDPECGVTVFIPPTDFQINLSEPVDPTSVQPSDVTVNGIPADSAALTNGNMTIDFTFNTSPAVPGVNTMHIPAGAFDCGPPVDFNCVFRLEHTKGEANTQAAPYAAASPVVRSKLYLTNR